MSQHIREALEQYERSVPEHDCPHDSTCPYGTGFYIIGMHTDDGNLTTISGGHKADPTHLIEGVVKITDELALKNSSGLPPIIAFARSRDMIHTAADGLEPPADVSAELSEFVDNLTKDDDDDV